ncbi:hypothetical protein ABW19_dt0200275 [Dactylella cylindrospora]|nr:hypothetical protein ABW19_dt0200275 [Dactylella cylindrospora]
MTALSSASRPLQRLAQSTILSSRSNGLAVDSLCYRCQVLTRTYPAAGSLSISQQQRRHLNITWGDRRHVPKVFTRRGKRQRLIEAGNKLGTPKASMSAPKLSQDELKELYAPELFVFRADISAGNVPQAMQALNNLLELSILSPSDVHNLAQAIHQAYRSKSLAKITVLEYLKIVIRELYSGRLPTHYLAHVHILSTLKEAEDFETGNIYWGWLKNKGVEYLDARVIGAAIEYLAYQNVPLKDLEYLYHLALRQFSKVHDEGGGVQHRATRLTLLQGIATARILQGDWKDAYEALDLSARLHPTQVPSRLYEIFIFNRPIKEGFLVFLMACRAGTRLPPKVVGWVMSNWWRRMGDAKGMLQVLTAHLGVGGQVGIEVLNKLVYAFLGSLPEAPEERDDSEEARAEWEGKLREYNNMVNPVFECIRRAIDLHRLLGVEPNIVTYNTIISQAGRRNLKDIVEPAIAEITDKIRKNEFHVDEATLRVVLVAWGDLRDQEGIKKGWETLTEWRRQWLREKFKVQDGRTWTKGRVSNEQREHEVISWKALIRACFKADMKRYILEQLKFYEGEFDERLTSEIRYELKRCEARLQKGIKQTLEAEGGNGDSAGELRTLEDGIPRSFAGPTGQLYQKVVQPTQPNYDKLRANINGYISVLETMEKVIRSPVAYDFTSFEIDLDMLGLPPMSDEDVEELKEVYSHFHEAMPRNPFVTATHDPKSDLAGVEKGDGAWGGGRSTTGYTVNQLRFENWVTVNRLLYLAEENQLDKEYRDSESGGAHLGVKGVRNGRVRREGSVKVTFKKMAEMAASGGVSLQEVLDIRAKLMALAEVPGLGEDGESPPFEEVKKVLAPVELQAEDTQGNQMTPEPQPEVQNISTSADLRVEEIQNNLQAAHSEPEVSSDGETLAADVKPQQEESQSVSSTTGSHLSEPQGDVSESIEVDLESVGVEPGDATVDVRVHETKATEVGASLAPDPVASPIETSQEPKDAEKTEPAV